MSVSTLAMSLCLAKSLATALDGWVGVVTLLLLDDGFGIGETFSGVAAAIPDGPAPGSSIMLRASALDAWTRGVSPEYEESDSTSACCDCCDDSGGSCCC